MTRILIVEDEPSLAEPLSFLLRKEGYETEIADDGKVALAAFDRAGADLVLLDLMLPGLSGTEVCRELRTRSAVPKSSKMASKTALMSFSIRLGRSR